MDVENLTPLPAAALRSGHGDEMLVLLVACATYEIDDGKLELSRQQMPLRLAPDPAYANDAQFLRQGVSVCVEGFVYAPDGEATLAHAELCLGEHRQRIAAFGPRTWRKTARGKLEPSAPRPFQRVAMSWELAFGGTVHRPNQVLEHKGEQLLVPEHDEGFVLNLPGTGFYLDEAMAVDEPLPQLEDPDSLIGAVDDRPEPVCFAPYPLSGGMRAASLLEDGVVQVERAPRVLGRACPRGTFAEVPVGTSVAVSGMRPAGERLSFAVPEPPVVFDVRVGEVRRRLCPELEAADIDTEQCRVRLVYRRAFRYPIVRFERRRVRVEPAEPLSQGAKPSDKIRAGDPDAP